MSLLIRAFTAIASLHDVKSCVRVKCFSMKLVQVTMKPELCCNSQVVVTDVFLQVQGASLSEIDPRDKNFANQNKKSAKMIRRAINAKAFKAAKMLADQFSAEASLSHFGTRPLDEG